MFRSIGSLPIGLALLPIRLVRTNYRMRAHHSKGGTVVSIGPPSHTPLAAVFELRKPGGNAKDCIVGYLANGVHDAELDE